MKPITPKWSACLLDRRGSSGIFRVGGGCGYAHRVSGSEPIFGAGRDGVRLLRTPAGEDLISGYFVAQARRPSELWDVDVAALTSYQRALLVNDGTVTRLVESSVLEPLAVDVLDQRAVDVDDQRDSWLDSPVAATTRVLRRRVAIHGRRSDRLYGLAESLLVASRLPDAFISSLLDCPAGLGELIAQMRLETRRELLWFGYAIAPGWAQPASTQLPLLTRSYRIITGGSPAILISESFPLDDPTGAAAADGNRRSLSEPADS
jgi:chorismate-pyruvate lyase